MRINCMYPEGRLTLAQRQQLQQGLQSVLKPFNEGRKPMMLWCRLKSEQAFRARESSGLVSVSLILPDGTSEKVRNTLLRAVNDLWLAMGQDDRDLMIAGLDSATFNPVQRSLLMRLSPMARLAFVLKTLGRLVTSRARTGLAEYALD